MSLDLSPAAVVPAPATTTADTPSLSRPARAGPPRVLAVLVTHDGAAYLPRAVAALRRQTRPADLVVGVDTGSLDDSRRLLEPVAHLVAVTGRGTGFGDAVRSAISVADAAGLQPAPDPRPQTPTGAGPTEAGSTAADVPGTDWLWLLHDDCAPAPDALQRLLTAVEIAPSVAVAGCKQLGWDDARHVHEVGFTVSRAGGRVTGLDTDELDQGQHDDREDVLAVSTAGMLVRRDVWDALGGTDPALPLFRDDLDLCRRAHLAGHRVVVVPRAAVRHAQAATSGDRDVDAAACTARRADRRHALYLHLVHARAGSIALVALALLGSVLVRSLFLLVAGQPTRAGEEWAALAGVLRRPGRIWSARRLASRTRRVPRRTLRPLDPSLHDVTRAHRDRWLQRHHGEGPAAAAEPPPASPRSPARAAFGHPMVVPALLLLAASLVAGRDLIGRGAVLAQALVPAPATTAELWRSATSTWRPQGLGAAGPADPLMVVLSGLSVLSGGSPRVAVQALLLLALPLAGLSAWASAGAVSRSRALRLWAALVWAAAPPLLLGLDQGRIGAVLAHVLLPLAVLATAQALRCPVAASGSVGRDTSAVGPAARAGLAWAVVVACAPVLLPAALVLAAVLLVVVRGRRGALGLATAVPVLLLAPWWRHLLADPRALVADPGLPVPAVVPPPWLHLLLHPQAPARWQSLPEQVSAVAPLLVAAPLLLLAAGALVRDGRRRGVLIGWLIAVTGLAAALVAERVEVAVAPGGMVSGWSGPGVSLLALGLLVAAVHGLDGVQASLGKYWFGGRRLVAGLLAAVAVVTPLAGLGAWTGQRAQGGGAEVAAGVPAPAPRLADPDVLPGVAIEAAASARQSRTLVLHERPGDDISSFLAREGGPRLGDSSTLLEAAAVPGSAGTASAGSDAARRALEVTSVRLLAGTGADLRADLADLGVAFVLLRAPVSDAAARSLDATPGLVRASGKGDDVLWRVEPATGDGLEAADRGARARVLTAEGAPLRALPRQGDSIRAPVSAGGSGRLVVLAERADAGWRAMVDGVPLAPGTRSGWAQSFVLPAAGGELTLWHEPAGERWVRWGWLGVLAIVVLLALPRLRPRPRR